SIVISSSKYNELYTDDEYDNKMKAFTSNYSFLFLGFSLQDVFTQRLLQQHRKYFKGNHYMLVSEESIQGTDILSFREEYGVKVITYNINDSDHYHEIKKFLNHLCDSHEGEKQIESSIDEKTSPNGKIVGAKITDFNANHEDSLFYKKLKLANIQDQSIYLSKLFYISAEKFIREAKRLGVSIEIIDGILAQVFMSYHDNFVRIYDSDKQNSQELLEVMHSSLEEIDLNRYVEQRIMPNRYESKGMIHLLADDEQKDIWWGSERFE
ncbi:SIR2 family protein, partial [Enterococcus faecalis]|nr:SIR2 family protein [Enterococcus faecalis]